jgi:hypothetical protein
MITAVDTNNLLDVLTPEAPAVESSQQLLDASLRQGSLVISSRRRRESLQRSPRAWMRQRV